MTGEDVVERLLRRPRLEELRVVIYEDRKTDEQIDAETLDIQ
jgi:hypothetical protein